MFLIDFWVGWWVPTRRGRPPHLTTFFEAHTVFPGSSWEEGVVYDTGHRTASEEAPGGSTRTLFGRGSSCIPTSIIHHPSRSVASIVLTAGSSGASGFFFKCLIRLDDGFFFLAPQGGNRKLVRVLFSEFVLGRMGTSAVALCLGRRRQEYCILGASAR